MRRVPLVAAGLAVAAAAGLVARDRRARREHVTVAFEDGSAAELDRRAPEAQRILAAARDAIASAR